MANIRHNMTVPGTARTHYIAPTAPARQPAARQRIRPVEFSWLNRIGEVQHRVTTIPDMPIFRLAFNAFARGALVETPDGPVAVEDLRPGMWIDPVDGPPVQVGWTGAMPAVPAGSTQPDRLYRLTEGSYGLGSGKPDLLLGPGARLMPPGQIGQPDGRLRLVSELADGHHVVEVAPRGTVQLYHIALASQRLLKVNDVAVESFHPGHAATLAIADDLFGQFLSLFPQVRTLAEFGPLKFLR